MSKIKHTIELQASSEVQHLKVSGITCHYCCGKGWILDTTEFGERTSKDCHKCNGTGELEAHVTIEFKSINPIKN